MITIESSKCTGCLACVGHCPGEALKAEGEYKTVDEVLRICMQDEPFYQESSGGVTLSGGEPLSQPQFSLALLTALKAKGIHTAMEITGYAPTDVFEAVVQPSDLLLFDMKHWDDSLHQHGTGVSNRLILDNMKRAVDAGKDVLPRLPVIPGYNKALTDAEGFVRRLQQVGLNQIQLLPFHQFGENKYAQMGWSYAYADVSALHEEDLQDFRRVFLDQGIDAFF